MKLIEKYVKMLLVTFLLVVLLTACSNIPESEKGNIKYLSKDNPGVLDAKKQAQTEMGWFIANWQNYSNDSHYIFSIKNNFYDGNEYEHMWVTVTDYKDGIFYGKLDNDPFVVKNLKYNDTVSVKKENVEDWIMYNGYLDKATGGFSINSLK